MKREIIAVDIDDVLVPHGDVLIEHLNKKFRANVNIEGFYSLDELMIAYQRSKQEIRQRIHDFLESDEFAAIEPVEESVDALASLKPHYELIIVTARPGITHRMTEEWLREHFPEVFSGVHFANTDYSWGTLKGVSKQNICQVIAADYLIDDSLKHIEEVVACGMKGILFGDYHWNQADELPENAVRVSGWNEALSVLLPKE